MSLFVSIEGGKEYPLFEKGVTDPTEFFSDISNDTPPFIEFVGAHSILTIPKPSEYIKQLTKINMNYGINNFVDYFDKIAVFGAESSGLNFTGIDSLNYLSGKIHYVKADEDLNNGMFNAGDERISLHNTQGFKNILDEFTGVSPKPPMIKAIWGLWHETGHLFQNPYYTWSGMTEVTVNICSYYTLKNVGHSTAEIEDFKSLAPEIRTYLENSNVKNFDEIEDPFFKLGMFAQLMESYGDDIFAKLNEEYRTASILGEIALPDRYNDNQKQQLFMTYISTVTKRDLSDFFQKWGLYPNEQSLEKMKQFKKPSELIERNIFYDDDITHYDGDHTAFESLSVQVKNIKLSRIESGIDSIKFSELFEPETLYSLPQKMKLSLKSFCIIYSNSDYLYVHIETNEGPSGNYKVPIEIDKVNDKIWGSVTWDFNNKSGILTFLDVGILGESSNSPWNRADEYKIDSSQIKKIVFNKSVRAPKNSASLFARLGKIEQFDNMSNLDTSLVTNMQDMFAYESVITKLNLSTFDTKNVSNFQGMFYGSGNIESLDLSNFDTNNITDFPYMFNSLDRLKELTLGERAIFDNQAIGRSASHEWIKLSNPSITMGTNQTFFKDYKEYTGEKAGKYVWKSNVENYKKVVFATDGGTTIIDQWVLTGEVISASSPSKENYSFDGWFKDKELTVPFDFSVPINEDTTIYAKWTKDQRSFVASDYTMYIGDKTPTVADFKASATDKTGSAVDVTVDFGDNDITKAGEYNVTLKSSDGQTKIIKLTVKANKQSIAGSDYNMYVGDKTPTASDFKASATDKNGSAVDVTADFGGNDITKAGEYEVTLRSSDDQAIKVKLTVLVKDDQITIMYRIYNPNNGEHFYTQSIQEKNELLKDGWRDEGIGWRVPMSGDPIYRLYNPNVGDHHYTLSNDEKTYLVSQGWKDEGIGWFSGGDIPIYRQYNPNAKTGSHNFTTSINEKDSLIEVGWKDEGVSWYSVK
ncbi:M60 family metallopeptidase [Enterococcus sp. ALS3]|uniref:M60 family metallopeptidase n=1 Tax=Enterococcus alishanensis TaxID=1303817 RepID=A0ABS6TF04_9ENTE|nr:M60 family metallopeptidase [Enterococcus alishanensis]MBV7391504.1 M60 family metallopeptidase [Enterococcus alishanensis]